MTDIMPLRTFDQFVDAVIHWECHLDENETGEVGVYSDTPGDRGGPTRWGVTIATRNAWRRAKGIPAVTVADMPDMPLKEAVSIYSDDFYLGSGISRLPAGTALALEVFDTAVGSGCWRAIHLLQETLNGLGYRCAIDGLIDTNPDIVSETAAVAGRAWDEIGGQLVTALIAARTNYDKSLSGWGEFGAGWTWRANRLAAEAAMTGPGGAVIDAAAAAMPAAGDGASPQPAVKKSGKGGKSGDNSSDALNADGALTGVDQGSSGSGP